MKPFSPLAQPQLKNLINFVEFKGGTQFHLRGIIYVLKGVEGTNFRRPKKMMDYTPFN
jgi:hypothetical protein